MEYKLVTSNRAKRVSITINHDGTVVVTKPIRVPTFLAKAFVNRKLNWIVKKVNQQKNKIQLEQSSFNKYQILEIVKNRLEHFNQHYNFSYNKVTIKNHKNLWGSCSAKKNLNFNKKIVSLTRSQLDYIIVHELCHIKELNHSGAFWDLVAQTIPNYREVRRQLSQYSMQ